MKRTIVAVLVLAAVVGGGLLYKRHMDGTTPAQAVLQDVQSVSVEPVRVAPMVESIASYGNLVSSRSVNIVTESPGVVRQILFKDGQAVTAGTPLVVMDAGIAEAQLQSSRAQADADVQNLRRTQSLSRQGLDSTYSLEQAQSRASASQAQVTINERKLAQLTLRAPFAGALGSSRIDVGAYVTSADTIVQLQDTEELQIEFRLPASVVLEVTSGMPVHIQVPGTGSDQTVDGELSFIDPAISTDTRSILLRAVVQNVGRRLWPGLYVRVSLDLRTHPNALVVPVGAVSNDLNGTYVFVIDDHDIARQRAVTIGLTDGVLAEVLDGVKAGDKIVVVGQFRLREGDHVKIVPAATDAKGAT